MIYIKSSSKFRATNLIKIPSGHVLVPANPIRSTMSSRPVLPAYSWREKCPNAKLFYLRDHLQANAIAKTLGTGPLGFDLEWRPVFVKGQSENPVALVQLSSEDTIALFQVCAMKGLSPLFIPLFRPWINLSSQRVSKWT